MMFFSLLFVGVACIFFFLNNPLDCDIDRQRKDFRTWDTRKKYRKKNICLSRKDQQHTKNWKSLPKSFYPLISFSLSLRSAEYSLSFVLFFIPSFVFLLVYSIITKYWLSLYFRCILMCCRHFIIFRPYMNSTKSSYVQDYTLLIYFHAICYYFAIQVVWKTDLFHKSTASTESYSKCVCNTQHTIESAKLSLCSLELMFICW